MLPAADEERLSFLYFSRETGQTWTPDAAPGLSEEGAAMWLPNNVLVELLMTDEVNQLCGDKQLVPLKQTQSFSSEVMQLF